MRAPFVVKTDGEIDFGNGYKDEDQFYESNMLTKTYSIGEQVTWRRPGEEHVYRVTQMSPLL